MRKHKLTLVILISLIILSLCIIHKSTTAKAGTSIDQWIMFRDNSKHTGCVVGNNSTSSFEILWNYTAGAAVVSSPTVTNGFVIVGSDDNYIYCLNASNGKLVWDFPTGEKVESSPAVDNKRVYIASEDGYLYCLNITNGQPFWAKWIGGFSQSSPTVVDGCVFVGSSKNNVYCFDASDGSLKWTYQTHEAVASSPAVSDGFVFFATDDFFVYALNATTGKELWSTHTGSTFSSPAISDGYVYIGSNDGYICALNESNGDKVWQYQTQDEIASSPAVANGYVYVGSEDNSIYCLNALTGQKIWQVTTGYWVRSSPVVAEGNLYVGSEDYNIYCIDASSGKKVWSYQTGGYVDSSPAIVSDTLYFGSDDHCVYAFALSNSTSALTQTQFTRSLAWTTIVFDAIAFTSGITIILTLVRFVRTKRNDKVINPSGKRRSWFSEYKDILCIVAILAFSIVFFVNLGSSPLLAADEQTYSQWAFHMVKSGDYMTPWAFGGAAMWISKPPLSIWLISLSYQVLGVNNFTSRLTSAVFGCLSLVVVFYLGKKLYNPYVGFLSAIVLGTLTTFYEFARRAMTDVPFVFFVVSCLYFFVLGEKSEKTERINWFAVLSGLFFGLALLTKQIQALLILLIVFTYLVLTKRSAKFLFTKSFTLFWGIALLIFSTWLIYMISSYGFQFWQWFFLYSEFMRTVSPLEGHGAGYLYYFTNFAMNENLFYVVLLPFGIGLCLLNSVVRRLKQDTLILVWIVIVLAVFTLAQTKLGYYILPAYPAFAIAIGSFLYQLIKKIEVFISKKSVPVRS